MDLSNPLLASELYIDSALVVVDSDGVRILFEEGLTVSVGYSKEALSLVTAASPVFTSSGFTLST